MRKSYIFSSSSSVASLLISSSSEAESSQEKDMFVRGEAERLARRAAWERLGRTY